MALTATVVLAVAFSVMLLLYGSYHQAFGNAEALLDSQTRTAAIATEGEIAAINAVLLRIGELSVRDFPRLPAAGLSTESLMRRVQAPARGIVDIVILDSVGRRLNDPGPASDRTRDYTGAAFVTPQVSSMPGLFMGPPHRFGASRGWSITFSRPLLWEGKVVGVVAVTVRLAVFVEPLRAIARDGHARISLLRDDGSLLASSREQPGSIGQVPGYAPAALSLLARHDAARLAAAEDGRLRSLRRIVGRPLIVSASLDRSQVLRRWSRDCTATMMAVLVLALAASALGRLAARALGRHQLATARLRRSEARLRRQSTLLQSTLDNIGEGISVFNRRGRLLAWNARFCELLELPDETMAGATLDAILAMQAERGDFGTVPAAGEVERRLAIFYREVPTVRERTMPGGRMLQIRRRAMPDGGVVSVYSDISEVRASERKLIEARSQAERANHAKSDFLANMSHELRTPLNAIIGFSEMICSEIFGPIENSKYLEYLKDVHASSLHLLSIINDILDMSKIEAGKLELADDLVVLQPLIAEAIRMVSERARSRTISVVSALPSHEVKISGDERALKQIMLNLLSNAVKFSHEGGRIDVRLYAEAAGTVVFEAQDYGIGIAEQDIDRVLQPFGQTRAVATKVYGGTGLGLPITKGLVAAHGGELIIDSRLGRGTLVRVVLPPRPAPPAAPGNAVLPTRDSTPTARAVA